MRQQFSDWYAEQIRLNLDEGKTLESIDIKGKQFIKSESSSSKVAGRQQVLRKLLKSARKIFHLLTLSGIFLQSMMKFTSKFVIAFQDQNTDSSMSAMRRMKILLIGMMAMPLIYLIKNYT